MHTIINMPTLKTHNDTFKKECSQVKIIPLKHRKYMNLPYMHAHTVPWNFFEKCLNAREPKNSTKTQSYKINFKYINGEKYLNLQIL